MNERAQQFLPFDTLKGFKSELRKREKIKVRKIVMSEELARELSYKLSQIKKGMIVKIVYFYDDEYLEIEGIVSHIDKNNKILKIVKTSIHFYDIYRITGDQIKGFDDFNDL